MIPKEVSYPTFMIPDRLLCGIDNTDRSEYSIVEFSVINRIGNSAGAFNSYFEIQSTFRYGYTIFGNCIIIPKEVNTIAICEISDMFFGKASSRICTTRHQAFSNGSSTPIYGPFCTTVGNEFTSVDEFKFWYGG